MIEISKHPDFKDIADNPGVSKYEIWYNKAEIGELSHRFKFIRKRRYILPTIAYFLFFIVGILGFYSIYFGMKNNIGGKIIHGFILIILGFSYVVIEYRKLKNMENHLFENGIGSGMSRWDSKVRKELMKRLGKRYWFAYLPFSAIEYIETKDLTSETSALLIHTKDGKIWPHPKYGIPYNRTIKGDVKFIKMIFKQYEKWNSAHEEK